MRKCCLLPLPKKHCYFSFLPFHNDNCLFCTFYLSLCNSSIRFSHPLYPFQSCRVAGAYPSCHQVKSYGSPLQGQHRENNIHDDVSSSLKRTAILNCPSVFGERWSTPDNHKKILDTVFFLNVAAVCSICSLFIHPSIHFLYPLNPSVGSQGGWSLSQRSSSERRGKPWTGRQSITGPHRDKRDKQPCTPSLTPKDNFKTPINLTCIFLDGGRKPEYKYISFLQMHVYHYCVSLFIIIQNNDKYCPEYSPDKPQTSKYA